MAQLYVEVNGNGPDLVLLHGWGLNVRVWDGLVEELRDRFRLIAVDLPGHGRSAWTPGRNTPAEQAWLLHSTLAPISTRYSLLGWSLGGQIALDLAAAMPAQIDKLVLVATTPRFTAAPDWPYGMKLNAITKMATQLRTDYQQTVRDFLDLQVRGSVDSSAVVEHLRKALSVHGEAKPEALESGLNTLATSDLRPTLPHVRTPTLVIAGQNDRITAPGASRVLAAALPDARYVEMRRAAHAPFLSHRKEFTAALEQFLRAGEVDVRLPTASTKTANVAAADQAERVGKSLANEAETPRFTGDIRSDRGATGASAAKASNAVVPGKGGARAAKKKKRMKARARKKLQASSR
ncbi:MAG TPA: pimeloyl-ACP methyl ester esterase BioH [Steroidobacteraceae bacterium]|nr:pimeloyl-ACP methyl ester esterase BioH [Steroidobacteraceae bacterium]